MNFRCHHRHHHHHLHPYHRSLHHRHQCLLITQFLFRKEMHLTRMMSIIVVTFLVLNMPRCIIGVFELTRFALELPAQASSLTHLLAIVQHLGSQISLWNWCLIWFGHKLSLLLKDIKVPELLLNPRPLHPYHGCSHQVQDDLKVFLKRGSLCCPRLAATTRPHSALHGRPQLKVIINIVKCEI